MTWARIKATGSGELEMRVVVEGWPVQFATSKAMERTTSDGRVIVAGLQREGISWDEMAIPHEAILESNGMTVSIVDREEDHMVTRAFARRPTVTAWLTSDLAVGGSSMVVSSTAGVGYTVVHIGTEAILTGIPETPPTVPITTRGYWDTIAQAHYTADGDHLRLPAVTDLPVTLEGRRAYLYVYGDGDALDGDGTLVWRGVCSTDAMLGDDGVSWSLTIDPISQLLEQDLGADLDEDVGPRGIYYPATAPLAIYYSEAAGATEEWPAYTAANVDFIHGYFASNEAFCAELTTRLAALVTAVSGTATAIRAVADGDADYRVEVTISAATPLYPLVIVMSPSDGVLTSLVAYGGGLGPSPGLWTAGTVAGATTYELRPNSYPGGSRGVPRGYLGRFGESDVESDFYLPFLDPAPVDEATYPVGRVYLGGTIAVGSLTGVDIELDDSAEEDSGYATVSAQSASARYVDLTSLHVRGPYSAETQLVMKFVRRYAYGSLATFFAQITADSPAFTNRGGGPFITDSDVLLTGMTTTVAAAAGGRAEALERLYVAREGVSVAEYVAHEARLISCFFAVRSTGLLTLKRLRQIAQTEVATTTITAPLIDDMWPTWERNHWGTINTVVFYAAYDPATDEWYRRAKVRDATAYSYRKQAKTLEIKPRSSAQTIGEYEATYADYVHLAGPVLGLFGTDYAFVELQVPFTHFDTVIGDIVGLTCDSMPNELGTRGVADVKAMVVGRRVDLDQGRCQLSLLYTLADIAGYAPSVTVTAQANVSGDTWDLTVSSDAPSGGDDLFPGGTSLSDYITAGDAVRIHEWGTGNGQDGDVVSVTDASTNPAAGTVRVTFDATWTPASATWVLDFDDAAEAATAQQAYAYFADTDIRIAFATARPARKWAA